MASTTAIRQRIIPRVDRYRWASAAFETQLGYMAILFTHEFLARVSFGHRTAGNALAAMLETRGCDPMNLSPSQQGLQDRLAAFAAGEPIDFTDVEVVPRWNTPFACRVVEICRAIPYGETLSYGEVAALAGSPGAARAVGNVMRSNHVPLVIPCHRVVGANGALGGYSAEGGLAVKERLLAMETVAWKRGNRSRIGVSN